MRLQKQFTVKKEEKEKTKANIAAIEAFGWKVKEVKEGARHLKLTCVIEEKYLKNKDVDRLYRRYKSNKRPISTFSIISYILFFLSLALFIVGIFYRLELWGVIFLIIFGIIAFMTFFFSLSSFFLIKERKQVAKESVEEAYILTHGKAKF